MADFSKIRRKKTSWPGFFSSTTPVRALPNAHLDEDAEVYQRVKHLQHLRAVQDALDETDVRNSRPGYNPQLDDLLGDPLADRSRFTDVFGRELGIGQTLDELRDEYGPGHVPGEHNEDPDDPRGSLRTGMASQDGPDAEKQVAQIVEDELGAAQAAGKSFTAQFEALYDRWLELNLIWADASIWNHPDNEWPWWFRNVLTRIETTTRKEIENTLKLANQANRWAQEAWRDASSKEDVLHKLRRGRYRAQKPRPEDAGGNPPVHGEDFWQKFRDQFVWGNPATDFKLDRGVRGRPTREVLEALQALLGGEHPAVYDRFGHLENQRRRRLTREEERRIRFGDPSINWGPEGPPVLPPGVAGRSPGSNHVRNVTRWDGLDGDD